MLYNVVICIDIQYLMIFRNICSEFRNVGGNSKITARLDRINTYKKSDSINLEEFKDISAVWRIFLLHIIKPNLYPIYDQHIHRAFNFIHDEKWFEISNTIPDKKKLEFYFNEYLPFVQKLNYPNLKALDEAFFAFGQYLKTRKQAQIFISQ